jgi:hypothetical protein
MFRTLDMQCVAILVADIVGTPLVLPQLFSTDYDENESLSETFFALVLARWRP